MNPIRMIGTATVMTLLAAAPGLAQNTAAPNTTAPNTTAANTTAASTTAPSTTAVNATTATPPASPGTASVAHTTPQERNPVLASNDDSRAGKVIGSTVYSGQDKKLGSVDDILLGQGGADPQAVISANGKLVLVPYGKLEFGNTKQSADNRVILRGETPDSLKKLPQFHYGKNS